MIAFWMAIWAIGLLLLYGAGATVAWVIRGFGGSEQAHQPPWEWRGGIGGGPMAEQMSRPVRAMQVWQILVAAAHERRTLTYGEVARHLGFDGAGVLAQILGLIMTYCQQNGLPPLTVLIVNTDTGLPGSGLTTVADLPKDREAVYRQNWYSRHPVQIADFERIAGAH